MRRVRGGLKGGLLRKLPATVGGAGGGGGHDQCSRKHGVWVRGLGRGKKDALVQASSFNKPPVSSHAVGKRLRNSPFKRGIRFGLDLIRIWCGGVGLSLTQLVRNPPDLSNRLDSIWILVSFFVGGGGVRICSFTHMPHDYTAAHICMRC